MAKIISLLGLKGGVGKTTTAIHLSSYLNKKGEAVVLVDADPNRSALSWAERGGDRFPVAVCDLVSLVKVASEYSYIVIDSAARPASGDIDSLVRSSDFIILPTPPSALALDVLSATVELIGGRTPFKVLLTMTDPSSRKGVADRAYRSLIEAGFPVASAMVRRYAAHEKASLAGVTVADIKGDRNAASAARDYDKAFTEILSELSNE